DLPRSPAAQRPMSLLRRASALNFISSSWAYFASKACSRSSKVVISGPRLERFSAVPYARRAGAPQALSGAARGNGLRQGVPCPIGRLRRARPPRCPRPRNGASMAPRRKKIYEGKAKILYEGPEPGTFIQYFKDDATAFNAQKKATIE